MSITAARDIGEGSVDALLEAIAALQGRLAIRLSALVSRLETTQGRIDNSPANIIILEEIIAEAKASMMDDEFVDAIRAYLESFDDIAAQVADEFDIDPEDLGDIGRAFKAQVVDTLTNPETYRRSLWRPITNAMLFAIATEGNPSEVAQGIGEQVTADGIIDSILSDVATAPDVLQRTLTQSVAERVGAEFFLYQGRPIKTTRTFCAEREGRYWHREEIADWGRRAAAGEDLDGNGNPGWAGMVEGTNATNIFLYLGGWYGGRQSCRHVLIPVARDRVPREDLERMRAGGYLRD